MIITVCASVDFYKHVNELSKALEMQGHNIIVPATALKMEASGNYKTAEYKTWYQNVDDFSRKKQLMDGHFDEVRKADAILVVNDEKKGIAGYIGGNVLMEMSLAYFEGKPVYVLNQVDVDHPFYEEVIGMNAIILDGDITKIK